MPPFYVTHQNAKLHIHNRRLEVSDPDGERPLASMPLAQVTQVVIFGNVGITTPAIDLLLGQGCEVIFLSQNGEFRGHLLGRFTPHVSVRRLQYQRCAQPTFTLELAKCFVKAKLSHQKALLLRHQPGQEDPVISGAAARISAELEALGQKTSLNALRGVEGTATAAYFRGYRRLFGEAWEFQKRSRRPPLDPVNAMLSFGYTLLTHAAEGAVISTGLDPYAGFLHEVVYNRPALALDIMEEFRPVIDGIVLWCCRGGSITPVDFERPESSGMIMSDTARRSFILAYEKRMDQAFTHPVRGEKLPLRQCIVEQARQLTNWLMKGEPKYQGMGFR